MTTLTLRIEGEPLCYRLETPSGGIRWLEAWWPETRCSPLPCRTRVEQWSDAEWRVAGQREGHGTPEEAAEAFLRERV